jgi:hypothetical protein
MLLKGCDVLEPPRWVQRLAAWSGIPRIVGSAFDVAGAPLQPTENNRIRGVDAQGVISTLAGGLEVDEEVGDNALATTVNLARPSNVAVRADGSLVIAEEGDRCVRKIDPEGVVTTVAGKGRQ